MHVLIMYLAAERYSSPEVDIVPSDGPGVPSNASLMAIEKMTNIKGVGSFEGTKVASGGASVLFRVSLGLLDRQNNCTYDSSTPNVHAFMNEFRSNIGSEGFMYVKKTSKRVL
jgi:hypothetical protein